MIAAVALGQPSPAVAVFNDFSPTVKGVTIGPSHCYVWGNLPGGWATEWACYENGVLVQIKVQIVGRRMVDTFIMTDNSSIQVEVLDTGAASMSALDPFGAVLLPEAKWVFPKP